ncbi:hypothetical protein CCMA1212_002641 [Trichoderma ghanense]|uniref:Uncharacterized protein n=1 Tax=Trichoderma ghanense TaxID=65468 RepID=A0ABY2H8V9_9HYPO
MPSLHHVNADKPTLSGAGAPWLGLVQWGQTQPRPLLTFARLLTASLPLVPEPVAGFRLAWHPIISYLRFDDNGLRYRILVCQGGRSGRFGRPPSTLAECQRAAIDQLTAMLASLWRQVIPKVRGACCHRVDRLRRRRAADCVFHRITPDNSIEGS